MDKGNFIWCIWMCKTKEQPILQFSGTYKIRNEPGFPQEHELVLSHTVQPNFRSISPPLQLLYHRNASQMMKLSCLNPFNIFPLFQVKFKLLQWPQFLSGSSSALHHPALTLHRPHFLSSPPCSFLSSNVRAQTCQAFSHLSTLTLRIPSSCNALPPHICVAHSNGSNGLLSDRSLLTTVCVILSSLLGCS